jgi:pyruvate/2-oxoglutarate dehydrogenase complex dihydrolipoamide dehydrogenase (E3) component
MTEALQVQPSDTYNQQLVGNVHPGDWVNPEPAPRYNLVVIGAGVAGLVTAAGSAGLGARVALIERGLMGGDCLNVGCVPSKALIRSARAFAAVRDASAFGTEVPAGSRVHFGQAMERMRRLRASMSPTDSARRFRSLGVDVFLGSGRFTGPDTVEVAGKTLRFRRAVIATGARASALPIPGLQEAGYLTNETVFSLTELPPRLAVIGAGAVGCELAQVFARFGSKVTLFEVAPHILPVEDRDAAAVVEKSLLRDSITILADCKIAGIQASGVALAPSQVNRDGESSEWSAPGASEKVINYSIQGQPGEARVDEILVGVGRAPNVEGLNLEAVGVAYDPKIGVHVNDRLQTTNRMIYAAGDICSKYKFTHAADALARVVIQNTLFRGRARASALVMPWCTYTDPEIAHVGLYEHEAQKQGIEVKTFVQPLNEVDRAILDGETEGFVKVHVGKKGRIVGATIVASHAGDLVSEITLAMVGKLGLGTIARTIHPYPTQAEAIKKVADAYNRTRLTPRVKWLFGKWLSWTR